jgi:hypothetical protein
MKHTRIPWAVAGALILSLASCGTSEGKGPAPTPTPPPAPVAKSERTPVPPAKLESPPPAPVPKPAVQPPPPEPKPVAEPVPAPLPDPKPILDPPPAPKPTPEPKPEPAPKPADVSVTGFETGGTIDPDGHVGDPKTVFAPADTVHLAVLADGAARSVKIGVSWMGPDGVRIREDVQDPTLGEPKAVPFSLSSATGLAAGLYRAEIRIEGWLASTAEFEVR